MATLEREIDDASTMLAHVNATIVLFERSDENARHPILMDINRVFKHGEVVKICEEALADDPMTRGNWLCG
jgi:hypothetical protein